MVKKEKSREKIQSGGIIFSGDVHISTKAVSATPYRGLIYKLVLVLLGVFGSSYTFLTCFDLPRDNKVLVLSTLFFIVFFTAAFSFKRLVKFTLPAIILLLGAVIWRYFEELQEGFLVLSNILSPIILKMSGRYFLTGGRVVSGDLTEKLMVALLFSMFIISGVVTFYVINRQRFAWPFFLTFPITIAGLLLGLVPSYFAIAAVLVFWSAMLVSSTSFSARPSGSVDFVKARNSNSFYMMNLDKFPLKSAQIAIAVLCCLCFVISAGFLSVTDYKRPQKLDEIYNSLTTMRVPRVNFTELFTGKKSEEVTLGTEDGVSFTGGTAIKVTAEGLKNVTYIRGYTGSVYTGEGWTNNLEGKSGDLDAMVGAFNAEKMLVQNLQSDYMSGITKSMSTIAVENVTTKGSFFAPYTALFPQHEALTYHLDGYATVKGKDFYSLNYYDLPSPIDIRGGANPNALEESYRKLVYRQYTGVPIDRFDEIKSKYATFASRDISDIIKEIRTDLSDSATYTLAPGATPHGKDFIEYFLYENKKGYCVYFASAAVMMFRCAGIPARYATGFVISPDDFASGNIAEIPDNRGHAWAEIYVDGYGWTPIEVTPSAGESLAPFPTTTQADTAPMETTIATPPTSPTNANGEIISQESTVANQARNRHRDGVLLLIWMTIAILTYVFFEERRKYLRVKRTKSFSTDSTRRNICAMYEYYSKLYAFSRIPQYGEAFERMEKTMKEITFSDHDIPPASQDAMEEFVRIYACIVFGLQNHVGKIILAYVFGLY